MFLVGHFPDIHGVICPKKKVLKLFWFFLISLTLEKKISGQARRGSIKYPAGGGIRTLPFRRG